MKVRTITTAAAATALGVNEMTIRRWAASGRLRARKLGKSWAIDAAQVEMLKAKPMGASRRPLELLRAARKVLRQRRRSEWLPDALHYFDVQSELELLIAPVRRRRDTRDFEGRALEHIAVPKSALAYRPGAFMRLDDEILYTALVLAAGPEVERALGKNVFSYRMAHLNDPELLQDQGQAWGRFQTAQREARTRGWEYALAADVAGFYEYVMDVVLFETLETLGVPAEVTDGLRGLIKGWHKKSGLRGLPQGPDASAVLANAFLVPVDDEVASVAAARGWEYIRWSDDIRVFTNSEDEARMAAFVVSGAMRRRGLYLAPAKTRVVTVKALAKDTVAPGLERVAYLFDLKRFDKVRSEIGPIFRRATDNGRRLREDRLTELRFCLYRLGRTRDDRALNLVLRSLKECGFLGAFVYLYLREFADRKRVLDRIATALPELDPQRDVLLIGQLVRVLAEAKSVPLGSLNELRRLAWSSPIADAARAVAVRALGRHGGIPDVAELRRRLWREADSRVLRAILVALKDLNAPGTRTILGDFKTANREFAVVVDYLNIQGAPNPRS